MGWRVVVLAVALSVVVRGNVEEGGDGGVVLWAHGKSATDYYAKSVVNTANWTLCNRDKESFKPQVRKLNAHNIRACIDRGQRFAHIKPGHLQWAEEGLEDPTRLFQTLKDSGWTVIAVLHRENSFSRQLSGINWHLRHESAKKARDKSFTHHFCTKGDNVEVQYKPERKIITDGINAALAAGLKVLYLTYADVTEDTCGAVHDTLKLYDPNRDWAACELDANNTHSRSHVEIPLGEHVGDEALQCVNRLFDGHPEWSWMLQQEGHRNTPPSDWKQVDFNISHPSFYRRTFNSSVLVSSTTTMATA
mmetsp:Transcript_17404/g.54358  ORF Transcript_17404/g.54358 Transcript_17404/m.54358 type:complete len:306 (+) Transcript_17404:44-961(+)